MLTQAVEKFTGLSSRTNIAPKKADASGRHLIEKLSGIGIQFRTGNADAHKLAGYLGW
jgi:hypothetical protein